MKPSSRIIVNTLVQYGRTIINMALSLYSSRLVLNILGIEDYGIYSLVAGVVALLSFITNSLIGSTQRFLSYNQGIGNIERLKEIFGNSLLLHILIGLLVSLVLELFTPLIFNKFLNIPAPKLEVSRVLYQQVVWMVYISFVAAPYKALLVSRENIVYTSIIDVLDGVLKVTLVLLIPYISADKLYIYGWIMFFIQCFNLFAYMIYSHIKYEECTIPRISKLSLEYIFELSKYSGWLLYSSSVIAIRNQGLAIILNKVFGPVINASYGLGMQISGMLAFVSTSFTNAISPQLMAAEGRSERSHMWYLAKVSSKFSFLLLAMLGIPAIFEMSDLLKLWLGKVPEYSEYFASTFLIMQIVDMLSDGLGLANRAIGNIAKYILITFTPKLLVLPLSLFAINKSMPILIVCVILIFFEFLCMLLRIFYSRNEEGFDCSEYIKNVILLPMIPCLISILICFISNRLFICEWDFIITFILSVVVFIISVYFIALSKNEKEMIGRLICKLIR